MMKQYLGQLPTHARVVGAGAVALLALLLLYIVVALAAWFFRHDARINELEPRIARLQGYTLSVEELRGSTEQARQVLADVAFPSTVDAAATGTEVQQIVRRHMEAAGFSVTGSQLLAPRAHEGFDEIRVGLDVSGPMEALDQVLMDLSASRPVLLVSAINLAPARARRGDLSQTMTGSVSISAVRLQ